MKRRKNATRDGRGRLVGGLKRCNIMSVSTTPCYQHVDRGFILSHFQHHFQGID